MDDRLQRYVTPATVVILFSLLTLGLGVDVNSWKDLLSPVRYQTIVYSEVSDHRVQNKIDKRKNIIHRFSFIPLTQEAIWMRNKNRGYVVKPSV